MLKHNEKAKELNVRAVAAVRDLLGDLPRVRIESVECEQKVVRSCHIDALIAMTSPSGNYALIVEVKSNGGPSHARSAVRRLESCIARLRLSGEVDGDRRILPMLFSPSLSPESRAICANHDVAYLDLAGNTRLAFGTVYIERAVANDPRCQTGPLRSIFTPKAGAILRVLLREPDRAWSVVDLAAQACASFGHVGNVRKILLKREWIEVRDDGAVLVRPDALLKTWRGDYRRAPGQTVAGHTHHHGWRLDERLQETLNPHPGAPRAIYSLRSAARWLAPSSGSGSGTLTFYADASGAEMLNEVLDLEPEETGANVVVRVPTDESLFDDASQPAPGVFCTSPTVTYLDLWSGGDREAAARLAEEFFPWLT